MSTVVQFSPELSEWLGEALMRGHAPASLIQTMTDNGMEGWVARGIMRAFMAAHSARQPFPVSSLELEEEAPAFQREPSRLRAGSRIETFDRAVPVLARGETPHLALLGNLLSAEECEELIELARPRLRPSTVVDPETGRDVVAEHRTSFGMFFRLAETTLVARLDQRFAELTGTPVENGEGIQVLRYPAGALSTPHFDFLIPTNAANAASIARSGQRISTVVVYLNDVPSGGETVFPRAGWTIAPQRGNAVYFESCNSLGQPDHQSLHAGNAVQSGEKWVATKWVRQRRFVPAGEEPSV